MVTSGFTWAFGTLDFCCPLTACANNPTALADAVLMKFLRFIGSPFAVVFTHVD
jgi:hypothetical protein